MWVCLSVCNLSCVCGSVSVCLYANPCFGVCMSVCLCVSKGCTFVAGCASLGIAVYL